MYDYTDIVWTKNIVRKDKRGWAYENADFNEPFDLQWPTSKRGSVLKANPGDVMLLFQKPERINGKRNYHVMLTHLITPIDTVERRYGREGYGFGRRVLLIAKPANMDAIPNLDYFNFFKPNRGATNPFSNIESREGLGNDGTQLRVWNLFTGHFNPFLNNIRQTQNEPELIPSAGAEEGDIRLVEHKRVEERLRNSAIVKLAKALAYQRGQGHILCECCRFDFIADYGIHGDGFIECHHRTPIASGGIRITQTQDLAMVCSNCHRMLHRKRSDGNFFTVEELRDLISINRMR